jgi:hypothetical protein
MVYLRTLFSSRGIVIVIYILVGVFVNTAPPHLPTAAFSVGALHSWVQYFISILFWPLSLWNPNFTVGQWVP